MIRYRVNELKLREIQNKADNRSKYKSQNSRLRASFDHFDDEQSTVYYKVTSSNGKDVYSVRINLTSFNNATDRKDDMLAKALMGDIKVDCSCPAFLYQGYRFNATMQDASIIPEKRPPNKTNPHRNGLACKHIIVALNSLAKDYDKIRNTL